MPNLLIPELFRKLQLELDKELLKSGMQKTIYLANVRLMEASMWYDKTDFRYTQQTIETN